MHKRLVQRKARGAAARGAKIPESGGSALGADLRERMQGAIGADLGSVKVHTDAESAEAANEFNARAFTVGEDVHFAAGEFAPGTPEGDRLIAHELTHVVQGQRSGVKRKPNGPDAKAAEVSQPGDAAELEADEVADSAAGKLHGAGKETQIAAGKVQAPAIGAKLDETKIHLAGRDPLHSSTRGALGGGPEVSGMHVGDRGEAGMARTPRHHVLPQEHRTWFAERGVNVDDYCVELGQGEHSATHTMGWNQEVITTLQLIEQQQGGKKLTKAQIVREARKLMVKFKIGDLPFVHYEGPDDDAADDKKKK